jgi:outer membrane lipoprotein-sorting protein
MQTTTARRLRWIAPFAAGAAIAAAAILPGVAAGSDHPSLPAQSATQLLAAMATAPAPQLSGTVVETARLGLPQLPSTGASDASLNLQNLITGSHTARVWLDGDQRQRVALVGDLAESDVVHNGTDVWIYSSTADQATHVKVSAAQQADAVRAATKEVPLTPAQLAAEIVAKVTPSTAVSVDSTVRVAGRPAYQIVLKPKDSASLITSVTIALDSQTKVPLRVQVFGRDTGTPALESGFTDVTFAQPPSSVFHFVPPTGATVTQATPGQLVGGVTGLGGVDGMGGGGKNLPRAAGPAPTTAPAKQQDSTRTIGSGWTAVVVRDLSGTALSGLVASDAADGTNPPRGVTGQIRTRVASGSSELLTLLLRSATKVPQGHVISTALFTALITNDGHLYVGAVDAAALERVAATGQPA